MHGTTMAFFSLHSSQNLFSLDREPLIFADKLEIDFPSGLEIDSVNEGITQIQQTMFIIQSTSRSMKILQKRHTVYM